MRRREIPKPGKPVRRKIANHIFAALLVGVAVPVFLTSPYGLYYLVKGGVKYFFRRSDLEREIGRMAKRGYVALTKTPEGFLIRLLKHGQKRVSEAKLQTLKLPTEAAWDKKWRLFIFDIPEKERNGRDKLRKKLKELGFYNIQRSVFVYPHDCREELKFITEYYGLDKYTTYVEAASIDIDSQLRRHFQVS